MLKSRRWIIIGLIIGVPIGAFRLTCFAASALIIGDRIDQDRVNQLTLIDRFLSYEHSQNYVYLYPRNSPYNPALAHDSERRILGALSSYPMTEISQERAAFLSKEFPNDGDCASVVFSYYPQDKTKTRYELSLSGSYCFCRVNYAEGEKKLSAHNSSRFYEFSSDLGKNVFEIAKGLVSASTI